MEQTWAEYLTLIISIAFLPWELIELIRRATVWRAGIIGANMVIVIYLLWFLRNFSTYAQRKKNSLRD
jgi:uncharacterized membrane protein (DUF2068 family)